ncbi:MAG: hypothetical protein HFE90_09310 [Firmicutes bacterium]|nr:hypothetical protein [Bacillota bacterium]
MSNEKEIKDITGLTTAPDEEIKTKGISKKEREIDLTAALLEAAEFKTSEDLIVDAEIKRNEKPLFSVRVHPISEKDIKNARKQATSFTANPNGRKLPPIEKEFDSAKFNSLIIYLATVEEDQHKIWNNAALKEKYGLIQPWESVDALLMFGEKQWLLDTVLDISGMGEDYGSDEEEKTPEDYAKN